MRWLVRLIASKGALVLDPFAGSGTTGLAAHDEGCDYLLIEQDPDYVDIARARLGDSLDDRHDAPPGASRHSPA
jgi:site-specific DNA-methyltransferase (adenine-specific)